MDGKWDASEAFPLDDDEPYYSKCLAADAPRLFRSGDTNEIEVLFTTKKSTEVVTKMLKEKDTTLGTTIPKNDIRHLVYVILQENSGSHLLIAFETFRSLLSQYNVFRPYLGYVQAFGSRTTDEGRSRSAYIWQKARYSVYDEFAYNIKYVARSNRDGNPWSIRQVGVYERWDVDADESICIVLQHSERVLRRMGEDLEARSKGMTPGGHETGSQTMALHASILIAAGRGWSVYLEDLGLKVLKLNQGAIYTSEGKEGHRRFDFKITFESRQTVQLCRNKLMIALRALNTNIQIVQGCKARLHHFAKPINSGRAGQTAGVKALNDRLEWHLAELIDHRSVARSVIDQCAWTASLQEKILEYRNDEALNFNGQSLRDLAAAQKGESENVTKLTTQTARDSKMLKALTVMASLYLPASLLATIFDSSLIQSETSASSTSAADTHLVVAHDFWIYIVIVVPLTASTALLVTWMRWRAKRKIY